MHSNFIENKNDNYLQKQNQIIISNFDFCISMYKSFDLNK
jgi:hypothetical protein